MEVIRSLGPRIVRQLLTSPRVVVLRELPRVSRPLAGRLIATTLISGLLPPAQIVANGWLMAQIVEAVGGGPDRALAPAMWAVALVGALQLSAFAATALGSAIAAALAARAVRFYDDEIIAAMAAPSGIEHLEVDSLRDRIENATGSARGSPIAQAIGIVNSAWVTSIASLGALVLVAQFHIALAATVAALRLLQRRHWRGRYERITAAILNTGGIHRKSGYLRDLSLTPDAAKEVRMFGLSGWLRDRFHGEWEASMAPAWVMARAGASRTAAMGIADSALWLTVGWLLIDAAQSGSLAVARVVVTLQALAATSSIGAPSDSDQVLAEGARRIPLHRAAVRELRHLAEPSSTETPIAVDGPRESIEFRDVTFAYPGTSRNVLDGFNLRIESGQSLAVVGVNGAGKSTFVKLLAGLHRPQGGHVLIDGKKLEDLDQRAWQRNVAAIFQNFVRYPLSLAENVGIGAPEYQRDSVRLVAVAARAGADSLEQVLPHGWSTILDRQFALGAELSGGQWQRVGLARALFAVECGAKVLVLDEPSAALDVRAEAELYERFLDLTTGVTSVVISHRFSTVRRAARIIVLDEGSVVEDGSHDELMALGGRYARMFRIQAERYVDPPIVGTLGL